MGFWLKQLRQKQNKKCCIARYLGMSSKQQKIAEREQELIQIAHELVDQVGFANLTMDKLVAACAYSKGTVYNHFNSKEDLFAALGTYSIGLTMELMVKAINYPGHSREKALALNFAYQLYAKLEPALYMCVISTKSAAVLEKASAARLAAFRAKEREIGQLLDQVFINGKSDGSLPIKSSEQQASHQIALYSFASWALSFGANLLTANSQAILAVERLNQHNIILDSINVLLDGMQWQPLSTEFNYYLSWEKIEAYFSDYTAMLNLVEK